MDKKVFAMIPMFVVLGTTFLMMRSMFKGSGSFDLARSAKSEFEEGKIEAARKHAQELVDSTSGIGLNIMGNDGIAVHDGNMVLGRIALKEHHKELAKEYLLKAGMSSGSPTLGSFGPNMSLAKDLIEAGERDTVIKYFQECRKFWTFQPNPLDEWEPEVKAGKMPDFGANLIY